ncbi:MAG: FIG00829281: hypothetical protein, partial [uncultured Nocardioidaceae bacterium]
GNRRNRVRRRHLRPDLGAVPRPQGRARLRPVRAGRRERGTAGDRAVLPRRHGPGLGAGAPLPRVPRSAGGHRQHQPAEL